MANLRQASLRHANLALVARTVLAADTPPSRADVAAATSLTRSTVSRLVDELVAGGVLEEVESVVGGPGRPGRPATPLRGVTGRFAALGLQVGVGQLAARLVDLSGTVLAERLVTGRPRRVSDPAPCSAASRRSPTRVLERGPRRLPRRRCRARPARHRRRRRRPPAQRPQPRLGGRHPGPRPGRSAR